MTTEAVSTTPIHTTEAPKAKDSAVEKKEDTRDISKKINDKDRVADPANQAEVDAYLEGRGYTPDHKKIGDNTETKAKEHASKIKEQEIKEKKKELMKPDASPQKPEEKKPEPKKESKPRRTEADENARPGSKPYVKPPKKEKIASAPKEKKKGKFWSNTGKALKRTAKAPRRLVQSAAKTVRTPVGLSSYLLADIGVKDKAKRNGWKDRWAGYKKIRSDKK